MINKLALDRIAFYVAKLRDEKTKSSERFSCYRGIISSANDAFEIEVQEMDALKAVVADPEITEAFGGVVG